VALHLTTDEKIRLSDLRNQLPGRIADAHTHVARQRDLNALPDELWSHAVSTFPWYPLDVADRVRSVLWPGKSVWALRMPHAVRGYDHRAINDYLAATCTDDVRAGYGIPDDVEYTVRLISTCPAALKMYYKYRQPEAKALWDVFPEPILEAAADAGVPIIVHLPQSLPTGLVDLIGLASRFPSLRVVVAHAGGGGGQFYRGDLDTCFAALAAIPVVVYFDTALVWDLRLLEVLLATVGPDRVLFGTDEPLSLIRGVPYQHPRLGPRLYAPRYHWASDDGAPPEVAATRPELLHLLQTEAVLRAVRPYGGSAVQAVFHDNAARLFRNPRG
jgi:predicted TIM-barrel fold metal-dependent hydrolase